METNGLSVLSAHHPLYPPGLSIRADFQGYLRRNSGFFEPGAARLENEFYLFAYHAE